MLCVNPFYETIYRVCQWGDKVKTEIRPCCGPSRRQVLDKLSTEQVVCDSAQRWRAAAVLGCMKLVTGDLNLHLCRTFARSEAAYNQQIKCLEASWGRGKYSEEFLENLGLIKSNLSAIRVGETSVYRSFPIILKATFSTVCNRKCRMCWQATQKPLKMQPELLDFILSNKDRLLWVSVSGGEPTFDPNILAALHKFVEEQTPFVIRLDTNGSCFREKLISRLNLHDVLLTFEAFDRKIYESLGSNRDFYATLANVIKYKEFSIKHGFSLCLHCIVSKVNMRHLPDYARITRDLDIKVAYARVCPHTAKELDIELADTDDLAALEKTIAFYGDKNSSSGLLSMRATVISRQDKA